MTPVGFVFRSFNPNLGIAVANTLGNALTDAWTTVIGVMLTQTTAAHS
jgi:hypothetical protein